MRASSEEHEAHSSLRSPKQLGRFRSFIFLRFTLIIATSYLLLSELEFEALPVFLANILLLVFASNLALLAVPVRLIESPLFTGAVLIADTICTIKQESNIRH